MRLEQYERDKLRPQDEALEKRLEEYRSAPPRQSAKLKGERLGGLRGITRMSRHRAGAADLMRGSR